MRDSDPTLHVVKQIMQARQREAAVGAMRARHSRSGLLSNFLRRLADRLYPTGQDRRELP